MHSPFHIDYDGLIRATSRPAAHQPIEEVIGRRSGGWAAAGSSGCLHQRRSEEAQCFNYWLVFWMDEHAAGVFVATTVLPTSR